MKRCPKCGITKSLDDFFRNAGRYDGLSGYCRPCQVTANNKRPEKLREQIFDALGRKCLRCGIEDVRVLVFDHIHGGGRQHRLETGGPVSVYRSILANLDRFQVLCHNCNFLKRIENGEHGGRRTPRETETVSM